MPTPRPKVTGHRWARVPCLSPRSSPQGAPALWALAVRDRACPPIRGTGCTARAGLTQPLTHPPGDHIAGILHHHSPASPRLWRQSGSPSLSHTSGSQRVANGAPRTGTALGGPGTGPKTTISPRSLLLLGECPMALVRSPGQGRAGQGRVGLPLPTGNSRPLERWLAPLNY